MESASGIHIAEFLIRLPLYLKRDIPDDFRDFHNNSTLPLSCKYRAAQASCLQGQRKRCRNNLRNNLYFPRLFRPVAGQCLALASAINLRHAGLPSGAPSSDDERRVLLCESRLAEDATRCECYDRDAGPVCLQWVDCRRTRKVRNWPIPVLLLRRLSVCWRGH
jgi:hypothetical protein